MKTRGPPRDSESEMPGLFEALAGWLDRAEILASGLEGMRMRGARAAADGEHWRARECALCLLEELPQSPTALVLWADAASALFLDHEAVEALERLVERIPYRADVWLRLARSQAGCSLDARPSLERAVAVGEPLASADAARIELARVALDLREPARAEQWLGGLSLVTRDGPAAAYLLAEAKLERASSDVESAARALEVPALHDGRSWLTRARLLWLAEDPGAERAFARAWLLDAPRAGRFLRQFIAQCHDAVVLDRFLKLARVRGVADEPVWQAAFATAEGRRTDAVKALAQVAHDHRDREVVQGYLDMAVGARDLAALTDAALLAREVGLGLEATVDPFLEAMAQPRPAARVLALASVAGTLGAWAEEAQAQAVCALCPELGALAWEGLLELLSVFARELGDFRAFREIEAVAQALGRPVQVAIAGEFNAGKSSLVNALLGEPVAPTGVLPTTATLNRLCWGPDRVARIVLGDADSDRVVAHASLIPTLRDLDARAIDCIEIFAPVGLLRRAEIIDTPGFNSVHREHDQVAERALGRAHAVVWVLDGTQVLKDSDRRALVEVTRRGLPLLVLANKADRLEADGRARVREELGRLLPRAGIRTLAPPLVFSARDALSGDSPGAGGFPPVVEALEACIVARSDEHRTRALAVSVLTVARRLARRAAEQQAERRAAASDRRNEAQRLDAIQHALRQDGRDLRNLVASELRQRQRRAGAFLPAAGLERAQSGVYRVLQEQVAEPLARAVAEKLALGEVAGAQARVVVVAAILGALAPAAATGRVVDERVARDLADVVVRQLVECLSLRVNDLSRPIDAPRSGPRVLQAVANRISSLVESTSSADAR